MATATETPNSETSVALHERSLHHHHRSPSQGSRILQGRALLRDWCGCRTRRGCRRGRGCWSWRRCRNACDDYAALSDNAGVLLREIVDRQELALPNVDRERCTLDDARLKLCVGGERGDCESNQREQRRDQPLHRFNSRRPIYRNG